MLKNNKGFTLVELLISMSLLSIFLLLVTAILTMTTNVSQKFLDYTDYEYAMMHKKVFQLYDESRKVSLLKNKLILENDKEDRKHDIVFTSQKIYKQTKNPGENFASGYSLLLDNIKSYNFEKNADELIIRIVDRGGKNRSIKLFLKDQIKKDKEKEEKLKKEKEIEEKELNLEKEANKKADEEYKQLLLEEEKYRKEKVAQVQKILDQIEKEDRENDDKISEENKR